MKFAVMIDHLTWKKIVVITLIALFTLWVIREIFVWTAFNEAKKMVGQFNAQFEQQQQQIHHQLADADDEMDKQRKIFDDSFNQSHEMIEEAQKQFKETSDQLEKEALAREKKFDEDFAKAPQQMFAEQKEMNQQMFDEFKKESQQQSRDFKNQVMDVDKTIAVTRCDIVLGNRPSNRNAPAGLTPQQLKARFANLMRIRREIAKAEHCEAYV